MRNIIKLTKMRPSHKYIKQLNSTVKQLNEKVTLINDILVYQLLLCNTVYVPMFAFYMIYN